MNSIKSMLFLVFFSFALNSAVTAQLLVVKKPVRPKVVVVKKAKPGKNFIWVEGHWKVNGAKYVWVNGKWIKNRPGHRWLKGHWKKTRRGWIWISGHWK